MNKKADNAAVTIAVRIEKGHLVPVATYDLELLSQWREGAILAIQPMLTEVRPEAKRYFAMLSELLKEAETPWKDSNEAHKAIKEATGFVEVYTTKKGDMRSRERHIASFTDRELDRFIVAFRKYALRKFGVEFPPSSGSLPPVAHPPSADDGPAASPIPAGGGFSEADMAWLKMVARMLVSATEPDGSDEDFEILRKQKIAVKGLTSSEISTAARAIAEKIYQHCVAACNGKEELNGELVATLAGCRVQDLRPEAR
jgi:hypothetical protein